jgi:nucleotide-binding universal stress UspA family protein
MPTSANPTQLDPAASSSAATPPGAGRIVVGVDGYPEGLDATVLAAAIAKARDADVMLVTVHTDPFVVLPRGMSWRTVQEEATEQLRGTRDTHHPAARIRVETDISVARAMSRIVRQEHRDLVIVGSSRHAPTGQVRIGKRTRQLLGHFDCALAVAPRGLAESDPLELREIAVGYDGGQEAQKALELAAAVATGAGAHLRIIGVVDDRLRIGWSRIGRGPAMVPSLGWISTGSRGVTLEWDQVIEAAEHELQSELEAEAADLGVEATCEVQRGRPADRLLEVSADVDLMIVGSRRWGAVHRVLLGTTGEALLHDASCAVLVVPRGDEDASL